MKGLLICMCLLWCLQCMCLKVYCMCHYYCYHFAVTCICIKLRVVPSSHWKETLQKLLLLLIICSVWSTSKESSWVKEKKFQIMYFSVWILSISRIRFHFSFCYMCVCVSVFPYPIILQIIINNKIKKIKRKRNISFQVCLLPSGVAWKTMTLWC